jgi:hypothetical protein
MSGVPLMADAPRSLIHADDNVTLSVVTCVNILRRCRLYGSLYRVAVAGVAVVNVNGREVGPHLGTPSPGTSPLNALCGVALLSLRI